MDQSVLHFDPWYLAPPLEAKEIKHSDYYIKHGEKKAIRRKIFENVEYDSFEKQCLLEFKEFLKQNKVQVPPNFKESSYLKMLQSGKYNMKKSQKALEQHVEWIKNPIMHSLDTLSTKFLQEGNVYLCGRDKQYRPVIYMDCQNLDLKAQGAENITRAMCVFLEMVKTQMMLDGKVENWIFIIDTKGKGIFDLPLKALGVIIEVMQVNFGGSLERLYILNPSFGLSTTWSVIEKMIDDEAAAKIKFLKKNKIELIQDDILPKYLQQKYSGTLPNLTEFWPPIDIYSTEEQRNERKRKQQEALDAEKNKKLEVQNAIEAEKKAALEKEKQIALEKERQIAQEKDKQIALEKEKQIAIEKEKQIALEKEKQIALEKEKQKALEKEKEIALEKEKQKAREKEQQGKQVLKAVNMQGLNNNENNNINQTQLSQNNKSQEQNNMSTNNTSHNTNNHINNNASKDNNQTKSHSEEKQKPSFEIKINTVEDVNFVYNNLNEYNSTQQETQTKNNPPTQDNKVQENSIKKDETSYKKNDTNLEQAKKNKGQTESSFKEHENGHAILKEEIYDGGINGGGDSETLTKQSKKNIISKNKQPELEELPQINPIEQIDKPQTNSGCCGGQSSCTIF